MTDDNRQDGSGNQLTPQDVERRRDVNRRTDTCPSSHAACSVPRISTSGADRLVNFAAVGPSRS